MIESQAVRHLAEFQSPAPSTPRAEWQRQCSHQISSLMRQGLASFNGDSRPSDLERKIRLGSPLLSEFLQIDS